jgi:hypothetical protein
MSSPLSRRAALAGALAAVPALAGAAAEFPAAALPMASSADPIFAAIERHKAAWRLFGETTMRTDQVRARQEGREVTEADETAYQVTMEAEDAAIDDIANCLPTTIAGVRALIEHAAAYADQDVATWMVEALLDAPALMTGGAA